MSALALRIENSVTRVTETGCWIWEKALNHLGYARIGHNGKSRPAHRVSYEAFKGPIPEGLEIDHVCKVRCCLNPEHLEAVNRMENMRRSSIWNVRKERTHCPKGHALTDDNRYTAPSLGNKYLCLECKRQRRRDYYRKGE